MGMVNFLTNSYEKYQRQTSQLVLTFFIHGVLFCFLANFSNLYCLSSSLKYIKNYKTGIHPLNWSVTQDKRGIIYVANNGCVLEFDGVTSRIINIPGWKVRSLAVDDDGTIYVGGENQLGYLAPVSDNSHQYVSLLEYLSENQKNFLLVYQINTTREGVYFRTKKFLFRWNSKTKKMATWEPTEQFDVSFTCGEKLYVHQRNVGLMQMIDDKLKFISGDEIFALDKIRIIVPFDPGTQKFLIGTASRGFFLYDGVKAARFPTEADAYLEKNGLYHGIRLELSTTPVKYALATQKGGLVIIDARGKLLQIFSKAAGLQNDVVNYVYEDTQGNLWLALDKGLSKIEYASALTFYNEDMSNLPGSIYSIARHGPHNDLWVGTSSGVYILPSNGNSNNPGSGSQFQPVLGINGNCWDLLSVREGLLAATSDGVFLVNENLQVKENLIQCNSFVFHPAASTPDRVLVGTRLGLFSLRRDSRGWNVELQFKKITEIIRTIAESNGHLWLGTETEGVVKLDFPGAGEILNPVITRYNNSHGLPGGEVRVFSAAGHTIFAADKKIYRFNDRDNGFTPDDILGKEFIDGTKAVFILSEDAKKNIWFHSEFRNFQAKPQSDGTFTIDRQPLLRIPIAQVNVIYPDPGGNLVWFGGQDSLTCYDTRVNRNYNRDFSTVIREVIVNGTPRLYDEEKGEYKRLNDRQNQQEGLPLFPYLERNFTFKFAAPSFEDEDSNEYRCILEGYDEDWSPWASEAKKVYTNLNFGTYTFRVQAKNVYSHLSREDIFGFEVLPPWYKTWWIFAGYALAALLSVFFTVKWRSGKLEREKKHLEQIVKKRTIEIDLKNRQLEEQTIQLLEQSGKLKEMDRVKSRFFANISHEFRTPLTLIIGPLEQMLSGSRGEEEEKKLRMMLHNSRRLLYLINQLLDLSKFDAGKMKLQTCRLDIVPFLKGITSTFESMAHQKQLDISFQSVEEHIALYIDIGKIETVMCNLLINAIKFTPTGGNITVNVVKSKEGYVEISVLDTGIGIPTDQLEHVFDRFYQVEEPTTGNRGKLPFGGPGGRDMQGTGIGLALSREMVLLHHGTLEARSRDGQERGIGFVVRLPMGKVHLQPDEIITISEEIISSNKSEEVASLYTVSENGNDREDFPSNDEEGNGITGEMDSGAREIILVVDDNAETRQLIRSALASLYEVKEAADGDEGARMAKKIIPDLVVSDIMMPGIDGYGLCRDLKTDIKTSHIPIILLTAKASEENIIQGLETGVDEYITKPFSTKILAARVKNLIDLRRQWQQKMQREMSFQPADVQVSSMDQKFLKEVQGVIEANLADEFFNVDQLGKKLYMSRTTLYRKILALTGQTPREFIKAIRLKRGAQLLKARFGNVTEVALEVGFSSTTYFSKCFKEKFQQLPSDFQASRKE